jgi:hypothetical protein
LLSAILLIVSLWIRLKLNESPLFVRMVEEGKMSKRPLSEAFGEWKNLKIAIAALLGATAGEAVIWYGGQFYALFFLTQTLKVPAFNAQILIALALAIGTPFFIVFGALSDKIGRKPIMLAGFPLAAVTYFYIFQGLTHFANPKLAPALAASPVTVTADPAECSFQFKPTGTEKFTSGCDLIKSALVNSSVNYNNVAAPPGTKASVQIGSDNITADTPKLADAIAAAVKNHGYPASADPNDINYPMTLLLLVILVIYVTMVYGPIAAWLVELFPTRVRYSGVSLPYHIGQRLVWRLPAGNRLRHRGCHRQHLLRPVVSNRARSDKLCRRADLPARNKRPGYQRHLTIAQKQRAGRPIWPPYAFENIDFSAIFLSIPTFAPTD